MLNPDGTFQQDIQCIVSQQNSKGAIFISNLQAACNPLTLKKYKIGAVITAIKGKNLSDKIPRQMEYLYIPVVDHESCDISIFFKDSFQFIEQQRKRTNVLVHCMAGVSRSVTLVIAYIMQKSKIPYQTAYDYVKSKRKIIHPNESFISQLKEWQKKTFQKKAQMSFENKKTAQKSIQKSPKQSQKEWGKCSQTSSKMGKSLASTQFGSIRGFYPTKILQKNHVKVNNQNLNKENVDDFNWQNNSSTVKQKKQCIDLQINNQGYDKILRDNIKKLFKNHNSQTKFSLINS